MNFSEEQISRYARHILLKEVGGEGQQKLLNAKVLVIGAGGLGSPNILYLAAAGVGTIGVVDDDVVDLSNLQRQVLHGTADINRSKVVSAAESVDAINPDVKIIRHNERITGDNAMDMIGAYDVVADGCDNFSTRFLVNDVCVFQKKTLVSAAILQFDAQLATYRAFPGPNGVEEYSSGPNGPEEYSSGPNGAEEFLWPKRSRGILLWPKRSRGIFLWPKRWPKRGRGIFLWSKRSRGILL